MTGTYLLSLAGCQALASVGFSFVAWLGLWRRGQELCEQYALAFLIVAYITLVIGLVVTLLGA